LEHPVVEVLLYILRKTERKGDNSVGWVGGGDKLKAKDS